MKIHFISSTAGALALFAALLLVTTASVSMAGPPEWEKIEGCRLNSNAYFDGDSFKVLYKGNKEITIRLYFADCPETDDSFIGRVSEQAGHFGKTIEETLHVGKYAKKVTAQLLSRRFTVLTKYQDAMGQSKGGRYYAFVTTADGKDLAEILVESGLARSYGAKAAPQGKNEGALKAKYDRLEGRAKRSHYGIYSEQPLKAIARLNAGTADKISEPAEGPLSELDGVGKPPEDGISIPQATDAAPQTSSPSGQNAQSQTGPETVTPNEVLTTQAAIRNKGPKVPYDTYKRVVPIYVTTSGEITEQGDAVARTLDGAISKQTGKVDLNSATLEELDALPHIGKYTAQKIIEMRPITDWNALLSIKNMMPEEIADLKNLVTLGGGTVETGALPQTRAHDAVNPPMPSTGVVR